MDPNDENYDKAFPGGSQPDDKVLVPEDDFESPSTEKEIIDKLEGPPHETGKPTPGEYAMKTLPKEGVTSETYWNPNMMG